MPTPPAQSVIISAAPMFHIAGLNCQLVAATMMGQTIVYAAAGQVAGGDAPRAQPAATAPPRGRSCPRSSGASSTTPTSTQLRHVVGAQRRRRERGVAAGAAAHAAGAHPHRAGGTALGYGSTETVGLGTTLRPGRRARARRQHRPAVGDDAGAGARLRDRRGARPRARSARSACAAARCSSATGATPRPRHARSTTTAGTAPATSA